ncbi:MAG: hypothetical protein FJ147_05135 [Deltaproteobacteria bacterium]|nr:hypothetical protein [Deltaproteobacteria bacterium]
MKDQDDLTGSAHSLTGNPPVHTVNLRGPDGERRLPADIVREDLLPLATTAWVMFQGEDLGDPPAYAIDLLRRLEPLQYRWVAPVGPAFLQNSTLVDLAGKSGCRALVLDGGKLSAQYLTTESAVTPESLHQLVSPLRALASQGVPTIVHFVFGYDSDDEGVFERTVRFCLDARIGLPYFSLLTPVEGTSLFTTLECEERLLQKSRSHYDGAHAVFRPRLMTPEALENGLHWVQQQVYSREAIWKRTFAWKGAAIRNLLANYEQRQQLAHAPRGTYTPAMQLLRQLSQPIPVQEQASFVSTLKDAVGETRRQVCGALLRTRAIRNEPLKALTLCLEGVLDTGGANEVLQRIHQALRAGHQKIVLDLKGLEHISPTVVTNFLEENAQALVALRDRVTFRHLRSVLDAVKTNLGGVLPNAELFDLVPEEA